MPAPGTFAQGNDFLTPTSGVGAYIPNAPEEQDPFKSFLTTYDTVNKWKILKEAEKARKADRVKTDLANLDINTTGIRPLAAPEFMKMKQEIIDDYTQALHEAGGNTNDPRYTQKLAELQGKTRVFQTLANGEVSANKAIVEHIKSMEHNPDLYSADQKKAVEDALAAPVLSYDGTPTGTQLASKLGFARQKSLPEIFQKMAKDKTGQETTVQYDPSVHGYKEVQGYKDLEGMLQSQYNSNPLVHDQINEKLDGLINSQSPTDQAVYKQLEEDATKRKMSVPELMAINEGKPFFGQGEKNLKFDPEYTKYLGWKYGAGKDDRDAVGSDLNNWFQMMAGVDGQYNDKGEFDVNVPIGREIGNVTVKGKLTGYQNPDGTPEYEKQVIPNKLLAMKIVVDPTGKRVWKLKTTESDLANANEAGKWIVTNDPYKVLQVGGAKFKEKSGMYIDMAQKFGSDLGVFDQKGKVWKNDQFNPSLYPDAQKPQGEEQLLQRQKTIIDTHEQRGDDIVQFAEDGSLPMTLKQKQAYNKFKNTNKRVPSTTELKGMLGVKEEKKGTYSVGDKNYSEQDLLDMGYTKADIDSAIQLGTVTVK